MCECIVWGLLPACLHCLEMCRDSAEACAKKCKKCSQSCSKSCRMCLHKCHPNRHPPTSKIMQV